MTKYGLIERFRQRRRSAQKRADKTCSICGASATKYKTLPPWPGTSYSHTSYACDAHESYLHGHSWGQTGDGDWQDHGVPKSSCCDCHGPYGRCGCHRQAAAQQYLRWERRATCGSVKTGGLSDG